MKKTLIALSLAVAFTSASAANLQMPQSDNEWYYNLGGEAAVSPPANPTTNSITIGGSVNWGAGYSCGSFDPVLGISSVLNGVKSGADATYSQVVSAASSAIASLPMLILQRANPGLYDMMMNGLAKASETVSLATKSCEDMQSDIANGDNPFQGMIQISRARDWKAQMGGGSYGSASGDIVSAKEWIETNNGKNGVDWIGGTPAGGQGMPPMNIPTDVVQAGYNLSYNRTATSTAAAPAGNSRLSELFPTTTDVTAFSKSLIGEDIISTYNNHPAPSTPARGLPFHINQEVTSLAPKVTDIMDGTTDMTADNLNAISAPNAVITRKTILALRELNGMDKAIMYNRLVQEIATARAVEKALVLRRLLTAGRQEPNVARNPEAQDIIARYLTALDTAINDVMYEIEINKKLASSTTSVLHQLAKKEAYSANATVSSDVVIPKRAEDGGITP